MWPFILFSCLITVSVALNSLEKVYLLNELAVEYYGSRRVVFLTAGIAEKNRMVSFCKALSSFHIASTAIDLLEANSFADSDNQRPIIVVDSISEPSLYFRAIEKINMAKFHWLFFSDSNAAAFSSLPIPYNCRFLLVASSAETAVIREIYKVSSTTDILVNEMGIWAATGGLAIRYDGFYFRRMDLKGVMLPFLTFKMEPCSDTSFQAGFVLTCIQYLLWLTMINSFNATTWPIVSHAEKPRQEVEEFAATGAQASLSGYFMTSNDLDYVHYIWPTMLSELEVYYQYGGLEISWDRYLKPFSKSIWIISIAWIIGTCCCTFLAYQGAVMYLSANSKKYSRQQVWTPIFAFMSQGTTEPAESLWERLLIFAAFVVPAVLIPAYSGSLTSFLAVQFPDKPFTRLDEMKNHPNIKLTGAKIYDLAAAIKANNDETSKYIYENALLPPEKVPLSDPEGVEMMCNGPVAFISVTYIMVGLNPKCKYYKLDRPFTTIHHSMTLPTNSQYENMFNIVMRTLRFTGCLQTLKFAITRKQLSSLFMDKEETDVPPVSFENIILLLCLLFFILMISLFILALEIIYFKYREGRNQIMKRRKKVFPFYM